MNDFRLYLERAILGACICENGFQQIVDILDVQHFSDSEIEMGTGISNRKIFKSLKELYPREPIDIISVANKLPNKNSAIHILCKYQSYVCSSCNLKSHALILLELCLRDSFTMLLEKYLKDPTTLTTSKVMMLEILNYNSELEEDIIPIMYNAQKYLQSTDELISLKIKTLRESFDKRTQTIRERIHLKTLLNHLKQLGFGNSPNTKYAIDHLVDLIITILSRKEIDNQCLTKIASFTII